MTTHEIAKALTLLSKILKASPNVDLENFSLSNNNQNNHKSKQFDPIGLSSFVAFSTFSKKQWLDLIKEYHLPIEIPNSDSARDVMGKIMRYFNDNLDARKKLVDEVSNQPAKPSSELLTALSTLLKL